ncbi:hypothetical protein BDR04DRAFT_1106877 [Suillus decipiens]|nr:hypothetical protein BDR04DRAFT_1106877 [Suillus decipiens]
MYTTLREPLNCTAQFNQWAVPSSGHWFSACALTSLLDNFPTLVVLPHQLNGFKIGLQRNTAQGILILSFTLCHSLVGPALS